MNKWGDDHRSLSPEQVKDILDRIKSINIPIGQILRLLSLIRIDSVTGCWLIGDWSVYSKIDKIPGHRLSFHVFTGIEPALNREICHTCDRKGCVNPDHLFQGTHSDNVKDAIEKGRIFTLKIEKSKRIYSELTDMRPRSQIERKEKSRPTEELVYDANNPIIFELEDEDLC